MVDMRLQTAGAPADDELGAIKSRRRILVVDDLPANLLALESALAPLRREVVTAASGNEALARLLDDDFCLVLLDIQMPDIDGYDTAALIRARPRTRHLPIIFITARDHDPEAMLRGYRLGAVDFLYKPLDLEILRAKASVFVALQDQAEALATERARRAGDEVRSEVEQEILRSKVAQEQSKQAQLARLNEVLAENDRRRNAFLAILGHELRNPLAPIRSAVELARGTSATDHLIEIIDRQSGTLVRLVDDLLDISRINANRLELHTRPEDLRSIVEDAVAGYRIEIEKAGHTVALSLPERPAMVMGDRVRLQQVLTNLLENACRHTSHGGHIDVACQADEREAVVRVADNGVGIPPELMDSLFEMFVPTRMRADGTGGLGLGLALSRQLVELHGGRIRASSDGVGLGASFEIVLPRVDAAQDADEPTGGQRPSRSLRIVVIDDNADARELVAELLRSQGHEALTAADGTEGLAMITTHAPDVAIVDLGLPGLDGIALAQELRAKHPTIATRLIALSGFGQERDKVRTRDAGFRAHLVKPARFDAILAALDQAMS